MKTISTRRILTVGSAALFAALFAVAQDHPWAGRTLDDLEWTIHDRLAALPYHGVFDTLGFELKGKTVTLSGQVVNESVRQNAERSVKNLNGVETVVNHIEVLPSSKRDEALRMTVYRSIYENQPLEKYATRAVPPIHIIVKNGWVTLEGVVDTDVDRRLANLRAFHVTAHVTDNLRVAPEA